MMSAHPLYEHFARLTITLADLKTPLISTSCSTAADILKLELWRDLTMFGMPRKRAILFRAKDLALRGVERVLSIISTV